MQPLSRFAPYRRMISVFSRWSQFKYFAAVAGVTLGLTLVARATYPGLFIPVVGMAEPLYVFVLIALSGAALLDALQRYSKLTMRRTDRGGGMVRAVALAVVFGATIVAFDFVAVHPADMNVSFPQSLLFYPVVAFAIEVIFHLAPLTVLFLLIRRVFGPPQPNQWCGAAYLLWH